VRELGRCVFIFVALSILSGLAYPFIITGLSQLFFSAQANGSMVVVGSTVKGSRLIGQSFTSLKYFHGRPSAIEKPYDASNSEGSNYGPSNDKYLQEVDARIKQVRHENGMSADAAIPADLALASASGLDPHISLEAALLQAPRVARARALPEESVKRLVATTAEGLWGPTRVNVLELNLALDGLRIR